MVSKGSRSLLYYTVEKRTLYIFYKVPDMTYDIFVILHDKMSVRRETRIVDMTKKDPWAFPTWLKGDIKCDFLCSRVLLSASAHLVFVLSQFFKTNIHDFIQYETTWDELFSAKFRRIQTIRDSMRKLETSWDIMRQLVTISVNLRRKKWD